MNRAEEKHKLGEEAFNRLHDVINKRRPRTTQIVVQVEDLKALLYDYSALTGKEVRIR